MAASTSDEPLWLSAWRRGDAPAAAAQPGHQPRSQGESRGNGTASDKRTAAQRFNTGFAEPQPWEWDGRKRREPVLDMDRNPPMPLGCVTAPSTPCRKAGGACFWPPLH